LQRSSQGVRVYRSAQLVFFVAALAVVPPLASVEAATITWHWAGTVSSHTDPRGGARLDSIVPLGTPIDVRVTFDPSAAMLNPDICLQGRASTSLAVLGKTYTGTGFVWENAMGFGPGLCAPALDNVEIVVPSWGVGGAGLSDGWVPFSDFSYLPGLWWGGDLADGQPAFIASQFPMFYLPGQSVPQRFAASLQAVPNVEATPVPEPASMTLFGLSLAAAGARRWRASRMARARSQG
jgi:hypothetical protein